MNSTAKCNPIEVCLAIEFAGFADINDLLYGEWSFSMNAGGLYNGDWVVFDKPFTSSDGTRYVSGQTDDLFRNLALARWVDSTIGYLVLVQSGTSYYHAYQVHLDERRGAGKSWVYRTNSSPSGSGSNTWASRMLYRGELVAAKSSAASMPASAIDSAIQTAEKNDMAIAASANDEAPPAEIASILSSMRGELDRIGD